MRACVLFAARSRCHRGAGLVHGYGHERAEAFRGGSAAQTVAAAMDRVDLADAHRPIAGADSSHLREAGHIGRSTLGRRSAGRPRSYRHRAGACRALRRADAAHDRLRGRARPADRHARASDARRRITRPLRRHAEARPRVDLRNASAELYPLAAARDRRRRGDAGAGWPAAKAPSHRQCRGRRRVVGRPCDDRRYRRQQLRRDGRLGSDAVARSRRERARALRPVARRLGLRSPPDPGTAAGHDLPARNRAWCRTALRESGDCTALPRRRAHI